MTTQIKPNEKLLFWIVSAIILLGALFVRLYIINDYYYNSDEAWHLFVASRENIGDLLQYNFQQEVHPPLSPLIWHFMLKISDNIHWIRSASYIPAILFIPSVYILGNAVIGRPAAFVMAVIAAFGALEINSGVTVRAYPMMLLAQVWMLIFMYKYIEKTDKKSLAGYFITAFISIQLVHSAALLISASGILLMWYAFKKKENKQFILILCGHIFLAVCVLGYAYILKHYYDFEGNYGYFVMGLDFQDYMMNMLRITVVFLRKMVFFSNSNISFYVISIFLAGSFLALAFYKRMDLLCIAFLPLIVVIIANYLVIYPFPVMMRNNLFLFIPFLLLFGFAGHKLYYLILRFINDESVFKVTAALVIIIPLILMAYDLKNPYTELADRTTEVYIPEKQFNKYLNYVNTLKNEDNVMVMENQMVWYFSYLEKDSAKIEYLTDYLGHFKSDNYEFYFSGFPGREGDIFLSYYDLERFATDLLAELKKSGRLPHVKNIVYHHIGGDFIIFGGVMKMGVALQAQPSAKLQFSGAPAQKDQFNLISNMLTSKEVGIKLYERSKSNSYITIVGMTPQFMEDNIAGKNFIDVKTILKKALMKNSISKEL